MKKKVLAIKNLDLGKKEKILLILIIVFLHAQIAAADYSIPENPTANETQENVNFIPIIDSYTPEKTIPLKIGEAQEFTVEASDPDNDTLSIQWYVNNLPVAGQTSNVFNHEAAEPGEFEIKVLITDNKDYITKKWSLTVQSPEETTEPEIIENGTEPTNETQITENITEKDDELIQLPAEINQKVKWVRKIRNKDLEQKISIKLPKQATNIKAKKITFLITEEVKEDINPEKLLLNGKRFSEKYSITGMAAAEVKESWIKRFFKNIFKIFGFAVTEPEEEQELVIEETAAKYEISYETPAPLADEQETETGKRITVYSDMSYENVLSYTTIKETSIESITFYWVKEEGREPFEEVNYIDTNNDSLIDRLEWVIPHLSNQTFEVELTSLNVQSYPTVGGNWTVEFTTKGTANLTVRAVNGTTWSNVDGDNDLKFLEIRCGDEILSYAWIDDSVFIEDWECDGKGYFKSKVLTSGVHILKFKYGSDSEYAFNNATIKEDVSGSSGGSWVSPVSVSSSSGGSWVSPSDWLTVKFVDDRVVTEYGIFNWSNEGISMFKDGEYMGTMKFGKIGDTQKKGFDYDVVCFENKECNLTIDYGSEKAFINFDKFRAKITYEYTNTKLVSETSGFFFELETPSKKLKDYDSGVSFENKMEFDYSDIVSIKKDDKSILGSKSFEDKKLRIETEQVSLGKGEKIVLDPTWTTPSSAVCSCEHSTRVCAYAIDGETDTWWDEKSVDVDGSVGEWYITVDMGVTDCIGSVRVYADGNVEDNPCGVKVVKVCDDSGCVGESDLLSSDCGFSGTLGWQTCSLDTAATGRWVYLEGGAYENVACADFLSGEEMLYFYEVQVEMGSAGCSCTYGGSGVWNVDCSDNCTVVSTDVGGNSVNIVGDGFFNGLSDIHGESLVHVAGSCVVR